MNSLTTYEIAIAEKAAQLPIPDLADQIWAAIEVQLDPDTPSGNEEPGAGPSTHLPAAPAPLSIPYITILAAVAAAVLIFFFYRALRKDTPAPSVPAAPAPTQMAPPGSNSPPGDSNTIILPNTIKNSSSPVLQKDSPVQFSIILPDNTVPLNSNQRQPVLPATPDSSQNRPGAQLTPPLLSADSVLLKKPTPVRLRGVSNISDSDYKIIGVKKDSGRGN